MTNLTVSPSAAMALEMLKVFKTVDASSLLITPIPRESATVALAFGVTPATLIFN